MSVLVLVAASSAEMYSESTVVLSGIAFNVVVRLYSAGVRFQ